MRAIERRQPHLLIGVGARALAILQRLMLARYWARLRAQFEKFSTGGR